jgi:hypothetical protein
VVKLSRRAIIRFRFELSYAALAENWAAILAVAGLTAFAIVMGHYLFMGPTTSEEGRVLGFGVYETAYGTQPIVRVRTKSGEVQELAAGTGTLGHCRTGDTIRLVRRPHALRVDMRGCS